MLYKLCVLVSLMLVPDLSLLPGALGFNLGWQKYYTGNPDNFANISVSWDAPIPAWIQGVFLRNGPGVVELAGSSRNHSNWMDGWAKIHKIQFIGTETLFSGRMVDLPLYMQSKEEGAPVPHATLFPMVVGDDKKTTGVEAWSFWEKLVIMARFTQHAAFENVNAAVWRLAGNSKDSAIYLAVTDNTVAAEIDPASLDTLQVYRPHGKLGQAAHFLSEPGAEANSINYRFRFDWTQLGRIYIEVLRWRPGDSYEEPEVIATFEPDKLCSLHSFSLTLHHAVFLCSPFVLSLSPYVLWTNNFQLYSTMSWKPELGSSIYIVNLKSGVVRTAAAPPLFSFHYINAYEDDDAGDVIIMDVCTLDPENLDYLKLSKVRNPGPEELTGELASGPIVRLTIRLADLQVHLSYPGQRKGGLWNADNTMAREQNCHQNTNAKSSAMDDACPSLLTDTRNDDIHCMWEEEEPVRRGKLDRSFPGRLHGLSCPAIDRLDFPAINEKYRGRSYCFIWGWTAANYSRIALVKKDLCTGESESWWTRANHYPTEMTFIPDPRGQEEDDGVLLTIAYDGVRESSYLLLLDAKNMKTISTAYLPHHVPPSFHGAFFPADSQL